MRTERVLGWALLLLGLGSGTAAAASLLRVEALEGEAHLERQGQRLPLSAGISVLERDRLVTGEDVRTRLSLRLGRQGLVELGPLASLRVERLPFASHADDLRTVLRLDQGFLRMVWQRPAFNTDWPLFLQVGPHQLQPVSGEFFVQDEEGRLAACVAAGELRLTPAGAATAATLMPEACHRLSAPMASVERDPDQWFDVRQALHLPPWLLPEAP
ncbi:MAG TPA: hypothetical protein VFV27_05770 [Nevskiaceae bacterium]|nr:hypothetical protein [Nevskiaceae bacterium]